jgi:HK97 family phage major capsid protein
VTLPGEDDEGNDRRAIYTTPGHLFVASQALKQYKDSSKQGWSAKVDLGRRFGKKVLLRGDAAKEFERKAFDPATLPILGDDAIIPVDRDPDIVRFQEPEILTIRDMLQVTPTTSDAIKFVRHVATTRGAGTVARGGLKPYLKIEFEPQTVNVETIAVLSKVTEQDVDDAPRLIGYINGEMQLDVRVEEERQIAWGTGVNELLGLFAPANGLQEFDRAEAGDTVIDTIRRMRTDLRKSRVTPNFVAVDPVDWEEVELAKGTDAHYLWGLISDLRGPRIWSMRVVESDAMTNPETGERRILEGDGTRGATVYDRNQVQLAVGFVDDDFARNLRTLRAEERLALAVKRSFAFKYAVTNEAGS